MIAARKICSSLWRQRGACLLLAFLFLSFARSARADGGIVLCRRTGTPFDVTVFVAEMPLRPGLADLSVLLEQAEGHTPILDAQVIIELDHEGGTMIRAEATRSQARNKLLYCSLIDVPLSGRWKMRVHVIHGNQAAEILSDLLVAPPQALLLSYWKLTAAPPVIFILFIFNQWLRRRTET
jgi:hypothetical protein